jgi:putative heme degradation protein
MHCVPVERHADVVKTLTDQGAKLTEYAGDRLAKLVADFNSAPPQTDFEATSMETYEADGTTLVFLIDDSSMCEVYSGSTDAWRHVLDRVFGPGA